jgi:hypothetical protein
LSSGLTRANTVVCGSAARSAASSIVDSWKPVSTPSTRRPSSVQTRVATAGWSPPGDHLHGDSEPCPPVQRRAGVRLGCVRMPHPCPTDQPRRDPHRRPLTVGSCGRDDGAHLEHRRNPNIRRPTR